MIELKITANSVEELRDIAANLGNTEWVKIEPVSNAVGVVSTPETVAAANGVSTESAEVKIQAVTSTPVQTDEIVPLVGGDMLPPPEGQSAADTGTGATLAPAPAAELDDRGVPWSPDFHAATKTKTQDGAWKKKRGGDHEALAAYEAQFTNVTTPAPAPTPTPPPGVIPTPAPNAHMTMPGQGGVMPQPDVEPEVAPEVAPVLDAAKVMEVASGLINTGKATPAYLQELAEAGNLGSIGEMFNNSESLPLISAKLQADGHI